MTQTISLEKGKGKTKFEVVNTTSSPIPVVIKLLERHQNPDGSERLPKTSELKAFPPQLVVPPNDKRSIRVDYIGKKSLKGEKAFRVVAEQVPLNIPKKGEEKSQNQSGIKMLLRYQAALYVKAGEVTPNLKLVKFENNKSLKLYFENQGDSHQYIKDAKVYFKKGKKTIALPSGFFHKLEGQNVLAGSKRVFEFRTIEGLDSSYSGVFELGQ